MSGGGWAETMCLVEERGAAGIEWEVFGACSYKARSRLILN